MALCTSNVTSGFIDLATYDELEKYMYGGADATAYFVRETRKSTWFTQVPVCLSKSSGEAQFGQEWSAQITRSGDYLLNMWLQAEFPFVVNKTGNSGDNLRWVQNLMHNLVEECTITFNDLVAARFDSVHLDFWSQFAYPSDKQPLYNAMIGNADYQNVGKEFAVSAQSFGMNVGADNNRSLPGNVTISGSDATNLANFEHPLLQLPLPFFFSRDSGLALPTASLPYNEMRVNFKFRDWNQLLLVDPSGAIGDSQTRHTTTADFQVANGSSLTTMEPRLTNVNVWANYAIVSNDERKRMACAPRDMLIEQVQSAPIDLVRLNDSSPTFNLRFSHAIKLLFFGLRNASSGAADNGPVDLSYYTSVQPSLLAGGGGTSNYMPMYVQDGSTSGSNNMLAGQNDPVDRVSLIYENQHRLQEVSSNYCSLVQANNHAVCASANSPGYHMYSYSLDFISLDPLASTNYGKLTNVSLQLYLSRLAEALQTASSTEVEIGSGATTSKNQTYEFVCSVVNNNVVRISGGALGFPIL